MAEPTSPAPARPAATVLLVRPAPTGFEVLMVRRHAAQVFASALVFPGGGVEPGDGDAAWLDVLDGADGLDRDARALRVAAVRETFEETGILLADRAAAVCATPAAPLLDRLRAAEARVSLGALVPFAHWITPEPAKRRFDTRFLLALAPDGAEARCDGGETVAVEWLRPAEAVARADAGDLSILFPTRLNLMRLAESATVEAAFAAARARPAFTVLPRIETRDGDTVIVIPAEAGYGVTENLSPRLA